MIKCFTGAQGNDRRRSECDTWPNRHRAGDLWHGRYSRERHAGAQTATGTEISRWESSGFFPHNHLLSIKQKKHN